MPPERRAQRVESFAVGGNVLLDARQHIADYRRLLREQGADPATAVQVDALIMQLDELHRSSTCDSLAFTGVKHDGKAAKTCFSSKAIVTAVQSCTLLRDSAGLERQMRFAVRLLLPDQADGLIYAIDQGLVRPPSASSVSRWRLAVDVGFMFIMRSLVSNNKNHAVRCLLADSSPQKGFDWFLTEWHTLSPADFSGWASNVWQLTQNRCRALKLLKALDSTSLGHDPVDLEAQLHALQQERSRLDKLLQAVVPHTQQPAVDIHLSLPVAQGSKRTSIAHKVHALLHTLYLEVGGWHRVGEFLASVRALTSDYGTESGLVDMMNIDLTALFPWTETAAAPNFDRPEQMDDALQFEEGVPEPVPPNPVCPFLETRETEDGEMHLFLPRLFPLGMQVPGALHVLHHAVEEVTSALQGYETWFLPALKAVTAVMGKKYVRERFVSEILRDSEAHDLEHSVLQLELNLHEARWGTLMKTCKELLSVRVVFSLWNEERVMGGAPGAQASESERQTFANANIMTEAIKDMSWWSYLSMILRLGRAIDLLEHWFEACPCHYKQFTDDVPLSGNTVFRTRYACHMAGRRSPELASGVLETLVDDIFASQNAHLVAGCSSLTQEEKDKVLMEFSRGQAKLQTFLMLKFAFWQTLPHKLCVLGHHEEAEARAGLLKAREMFNMHSNSENHHPLTLHFFRGPLTEHVDRFLSHEIKREHCFSLMQEAAACAFVPCVERSIEARRALLKAKTACMKKIRPATFSLAIRSHEFHRRCMKQKSILLEWERHVALLKSVPKRGLPSLLHHVGFALHPNVLRLQRLGERVRLRDVAYMVYRCDLETMYDLRQSATETMHKPHFRANPDDAGKLRRMVAAQDGDEAKQSLMLRILMMEHFKKRCQEGVMYSIQGPLPEPRYLKDSLVPGSSAAGSALDSAIARAGDNRRSSADTGVLFDSPDKLDLFVSDTPQHDEAASAAGGDDDQRFFMQALGWAG